MTSFLAQYGLFLAKTLTLGVALLIAVGGLMAMALRRKKSSEEHLEITCLNRQYEEMESALEAATLSETGLKLKHKADKKKARDEAKAEKKASKAGGKPTAEEGAARRKLFVLDFNGDMEASCVTSMRQEVSALLTVATQQDEVLVRLESGGGTVHGYGLGASQLQRIRDHGIPLTVAVDKIAASGGYMMACVGNKIISAPFAIIGSIGVLAQIPNLHRLLKKNDIDFEQLYAGEYKRTLTLFGENTDKGRDKVQADLEDIHQLFKDFVNARRPHLDMDKVATGEHWLGARALELGLVDELKTSDDYLMAARDEADIIHLEYTEKKNLMDKLQRLMPGGVFGRYKDTRELERPLLM